MRSRIAAGVLSVVMIGSAGCSVRTSDPPVRNGGPRNELRVAMVDPASLDPSKVTDRSGLLVLKQICDPLVETDPSTGALKPGIARSWTISPDAMKITFKIKPKVLFHNGRELVAQDYVFSMTRFADPKAGSSQHFFFERVAGYAELRAGTSTALSGVKAPDPQTLEVQLTKPFAEFPALMAHPAAGAAIPEEELARDAQAFAVKPICTGPYSVSQPWARGGDLKLVRHEEGDAGGRFRLITFRSVADAAAGYKLFEEGKVDVADVPVGRLVSARSARSDDRAVVSAQNGLISYIGFPVSKPPYDNKELRKALALSVDRGAIIERLLAGSRVLPRSFLPKPSGPASRSPCSGGILSRPQTAAAKASFARVVADPATFKPSVYFNSPGGHDKWLQEVAAQWKKVHGFDSTLKPDEWKKYLDFLVQPGADGPFRLAWSVRYPSAEATFDPLFAGGSLDNFTRYSNKSFDDLLAKARSTVDDGERAKVYGQAMQVLCDDLPILPMWFGQNHIALSRLNASTGPRIDIWGDPRLRELVSSE